MGDMNHSPSSYTRLGFIKESFTSGVLCRVPDVPEYMYSEFEGGGARKSKRISYEKWSYWSRGNISEGIREYETLKRWRAYPEPRSILQGRCYRGSMDSDLINPYYCPSGQLKSREKKHTGTKSARAGTFYTNVQQRSGTEYWGGI